MNHETIRVFIEAKQQELDTLHRQITALEKDYSIAAYDYLKKQKLFTKSKWMPDITDRGWVRLYPVDELPDEIEDILNNTSFNHCGIDIELGCEIHFNDGEVRIDCPTVDIAKQLITTLELTIELKNYEKQKADLQKEIDSINQVEGVFK